jgi:CRP/FNR family transcriptional regulator, cyclic AMP receptor protein
VSSARAAPASAARPGVLPLFDARSDFAGLADEARVELSRAATRRIYGPNAFIYLQDDEAGHLYFVLSGYVRLSYLMEDGSAVLHGILRPGESFGELGVFEGSTYCDMATAIGPVAAASIPLGAFRAICERRPEVAATLARVVARRYRAYVTLTRDLSLKSLSARLAQSLLRLVDGLGTRAEHRGRQVAVLGSVVTQTDLGLMARGSRGNVNRTLKGWERAGWIAIRDRAILILERERLEGLSIEEVL